VGHGLSDAVPAVACVNGMAPEWPHRDRHPSLMLSYQVGPHVVGVEPMIAMVAVRRMHHGHVRRLSTVIVALDVEARAVRWATRGVRRRCWAVVAAMRR
jgi:hypothetical protein